MIWDWLKHLNTVRDEDFADFINEEVEFVADDRFDRMNDLHRTDLDLWTCTRPAFMIFPYHTCKHLVRLFDNEYPSKEDHFRQATYRSLTIHKRFASVGGSRNCYQSIARVSFDGSLRMARTM